MADPNDLMRHSFRPSIIDYEVLQGGRKLGKIERFFARCHSHVNGLGTISNVLFLASVRSINEDILAEALIQLANKYEILRMRVTDVNGKLHFKPTKYYTPKLQVLSTSNWVHQAESELLNPMDQDKGPLWRAVYLPKVATGRTTDKQTHEHCLIFSFCHVIADSTTSLRYLSSFLDILDSSLAETEPETDKIEIGQPIDFFIDKFYNPSKKSRLKREFYYWYLRAGLPLNIPTLPCRKSGVTTTALLGNTNDINISITPQTRIIPIEFTKEITDKLQSVCAEKGTNLQGLFQAIGSVALAKLFKHKASDQNSTQEETSTMKVSATIPVNLRCFVPLEDKKCLGNFTSCVDVEWATTSEMNNDEIWDLAVKSSLSALNAVGRRSYKDNFQMYSFISTYMRRENLRGKDPSGVMTKSPALGRSAMLSFDTSEGQILDRGPGSMVTVTGLYQSLSEHAHGPIFANHLVTIDKVCHLTVSWYSNVTTPEEAQYYASSIRTIVNDLVR